MNREGWRRELCWPPSAAAGFPIKVIYVKSILANADNRGSRKGRGRKVFRDGEGSGEHSWGQVLREQELQLEPSS